MKTRRGFTVGELLAVIGIIIVLALILFPVFAAAETKTKFADKVNSAKSFKDLQSLVGTPYVVILEHVADQPTPDGHRRYFYHKGLKTGVEIDCDTDGIITYVGPWRLPEEPQPRRTMAEGAVDDAFLTIASTEGTVVIHLDADAVTYQQAKPVPKAEAEPAEPTSPAEKR